MIDTYFLRFPSYFKDAIEKYDMEFPKDTSWEYDPQIAFRGIVCKNGESRTVNDSDFLSYAELGRIPKGHDISEIEVHACSCFKTKKQLEVGFKLPRPDRRIIKGTIKDDKGWIHITSKSGHINWWIYENANPSESFEVIDNE